MSKNKKTRKKKVCPECGQNHFKEDPRHAETYCETCGLVLIAPPVVGIEFPGFKIIIEK